MGRETQRLEGFVAFWRIRKYELWVWVLILVLIKLGRGHTRVRKLVG